MSTREEDMFAKAYFERIFGPLAVAKLTTISGHPPGTIKMGEPKKNADGGWTIPFELRSEDAKDEQ